MFKSFQHFKKSTQETHKFLRETGSTISLSAFREKLATEAGFSDVNALKVFFDEPNRVYTVLCNFQGIYDSQYVFDEEQKAEAFFKERLIGEGLVEDSEEFDEALDVCYCEIGKFDFSFYSYTVK